MGYREQLEAGHGAFAAMLKAWHERNSWSHRVLPALAEQLDFGRLHSSQLSNLRNRKLSSPGPEVFLALGSCNRWLAETAKGGDGMAQLEGQEELLAALKISALPLLMPLARRSPLVSCWRSSSACARCRPALTCASAMRRLQHSVLLWRNCSVAASPGANAAKRCSRPIQPKSGNAASVLPK